MQKGLRHLVWRLCFSRTSATQPGAAPVSNGWRQNGQRFLAAQPVRSWGFVYLERSL